MENTYLQLKYMLFKDLCKKTFKFILTDFLIINNISGI